MKSIIITLLIAASLTTQAQQKQIPDSLPVAIPIGVLDQVKNELARMPAGAFENPNMINIIKYLDKLVQSAAMEYLKQPAKEEKPTEKKEEKVPAKTDKKPKKS